VRQHTNAANAAPAGPTLFTSRTWTIIGAVLCAVALSGAFAGPAIASPPQIVTQAISPVGLTGATLYTEVNPRGFNTNYRFEYGKTTAYGSQAPADTELFAGDGILPVKGLAKLSGLQEGATYHYRVVAMNSDGMSLGPDQTFTTGIDPAGCPNATLRAAQVSATLPSGTTELPACMALEMVSPVVKGQQAIRASTNQQNASISIDGEHALFRSTAALAETEAVVDFNHGDIYLARRDQHGWTTIPANLRQMAGIGTPFGPNGFAPDFSGWFHVAAEDRIQNGEGIRRAFRFSLNRTATPFSPLLVTTEEPSVAGKFAGTSTDLSRLYIKVGSGGGASPRRYHLDDPIPAPDGIARSNVYVAALAEDGQPEPVQLFARDSLGKEWGGNCGVRVGGDVDLSISQGQVTQRVRMQGAISEDGERVYFSTRPSQPESGNCDSVANKMRILKRAETPAGPVIENLAASECPTIPRACPGQATGDIVSGSKIVTNVTPSTPAGTIDLCMLLAGIGSSGIPVGTTIAQMLSPSELELSANATTTASGVSLRVNDGDDNFQGASVDGTKVFFTTTRRLANSDLDCGGASCGLALGQATGCDIYLYDSSLPVGNRLIQVSAGDATNPTPGAGAKVLNSIAGISTDGSHVYFAAEGVLTTTPNKLGAVAQAGQPNLYLYERDSAYPNGRTVFIGTLVPGDSGGLWGAEKVDALGSSSVYPVPAMDADGEEVGGDGHILLFKSKAQLTGNDVDGLRRDVYRYDSQTGSLQCISCLPGGDSAVGEAKGAEAAGLTEGSSMGPAFASLGRWVSEDGSSVVFQTAVGLLPGDTNGIEDEYLWADGQLQRLPGEDFADAPTISGDGSVVAFRRAEPLLPQDGDTAGDLYVARSGGGFPIPPVIPECVGEACQEPFQPQPPVSPAPSEAPSSGNVQEPPPRPCKKGFVRKNGKCVKRHPRKKHNDQKKRAASKRQGGVK
jgi:hypothetical protein